MDNSLPQIDKIPLPVSCEVFNHKIAAGFSIAGQHRQLRVYLEVEITFAYGFEDDNLVNFFFSFYNIFLFIYNVLKQYN